MKGEMKGLTIEVTGRVNMDDRSTVTNYQLIDDGGLSNALNQIRE